MTLTAVSGSTQRFVLPYDYAAVIAFVDGNGRSLDPIPSMDVRQFGEYNSFGSFVAFFENNAPVGTPLTDSGSTPITIGIPNRSTTVTASAAVFTSSHVGEWLLPIDRNTASTFSSPEDYGYRIASLTDSTHVELERPFRGVLSDAGTVGDLTTSYFEIRPRQTKTVRIWGDPGSTSTIKLEYQRTPSKLANFEDIPEEPRLSEALVYSAIQLAGISYREAFIVKTANDKIAQALSGFRSVKDRDRELVHNFLTSNPMARGYSQISGNHMGSADRYSGGSIRY